MDQTVLESAKEKLIQLYGTENCKTLVKMSSSEAAFSEKLPEEEYRQFIENIFVTFKEYKVSLESVGEESYGQIFGEYAVKIMEIKEKYGV